ncbi:MAG: MFS transporter [Betaproteobacteria bacterium]|nr:MAG: MFS transporter [Betaproteobacteria bacterium]
MSQHRPLIAALLFGNFVIGTGVMLSSALLLLIAREFKLDVAHAGWLITVGEVAVCVGSPVLATLTSRFDRRKLLVGSLALYSLGHIACALMPSFGTLVPVRAVTLLGAAIFTPQAAATVGMLVPPERRSAAITSIFLGWSIASVLGIPLAAWIGTHLGWRYTFAGFGVFALIGVVWIWRVVPRGVAGVPISLSSWLSVVKHPALIAILLVTAVTASGQFSTFAYIAPFTAAMLGNAATTLPIALLLFGVAGVMGNIIAARSIARRGANFNVQVSLGAIFVGLTVMAIAGSSWPGYAVAALLWGGGLFANNSSQQARLATTSPELAGVSIALNTSMMYLGQAIGTLIGAVVTAKASISDVPTAGAGLLVVAMLVSVRATRATQQTAR